MKINRRDLIRTSAALAASAAVDQQLSAATPKNIVIASSNGLKACCARAMEILKSGGDTLDAVVAGVNTVELDPTQHGVGWGGLPNEDGVVELDASVMHGPTRRCGSVASIRNIRFSALPAATSRRSRSRRSSSAWPTARSTSRPTSCAAA